MDNRLAKELAIPVMAAGFGAALLRHERTAIPGKLAMFFGAQTVMNLYMKEVLSGTVVSEQEGLRGIPSAFVVTAIQQVVAFFLFSAMLLLSRLTPYKYTPKPLSTPKEWITVLLFSLSYSLNIALNNFSISLLPLSVNLIIRSCLPIAAYASQRMVSRCGSEPPKDVRPLEILLMFVGVCCAAVAVVATSHSRGKDNGGDTKTLAFGVAISIASFFSAAFNLVLAGILGSSVSLNSLDTTVYMSLPAFILLTVPSMMYRHPVNWPGYDAMTDWEVVVKVVAVKPAAIGLAVFSGVLALFYNVFQYGIVQSLSASYTAFAGNFNKAATITLGLLLGLETLPPGLWGLVMALACFGNICAFTVFSFIQSQERPKQRDSPRRSSEEEGLPRKIVPQDVRRFGKPQTFYLELEHVEHGTKDPGKHT